MVHLPPAMDSAFEALLIYLRQSHNFDFTAYKRPSLMRRVQHRMQMIKIGSYSDYDEYIKANPQEFNCLFSTIEINVTSFFRDINAWKYIAGSIIPRIIASKAANEQIRVWNAGCASGEETYTLAILLAEALGVEQFCARVKIYSTDIDQEALSQARLGNYFSREIVGISPTFLQKYFEQVDERYIFNQDLRRSLVFARHNIIEDAPMSKIDLLVCRNVLIYLDSESQTKALARFHFSLRNNGFLFLGTSEMLPAHTNFFTSINLQQRVFTKVPKSDTNQRSLHKALSSQHKDRLSNSSRSKSEM